MPNSVERNSLFDSGVRRQRRHHPSRKYFPHASSMRKNNTSAEVWTGYLTVMCRGPPGPRFTPMLLTPLTIRDLTLRNRIGVSPMCQYSADDGFANDWHLVHLGSRAVGGAALVITEAAAARAPGRNSSNGLGVWKGEPIGPLARIRRLLRPQARRAG